MFFKNVSNVGVLSTATCGGRSIGVRCKLVHIFVQTLDTNHDLLASQWPDIDQRCTLYGIKLHLAHGPS